LWREGAADLSNQRAAIEMIRILMADSDRQKRGGKAGVRVQDLACSMFSFWQTPPRFRQLDATFTSPADVGQAWGRGF